jgi:hypothetical protein
MPMKSASSVKMMPRKYQRRSKEVNFAKCLRAYFFIVPTSVLEQFAKIVVGFHGYFEPMLRLLSILWLPYSFVGTLVVNKP